MIDKQLRKQYANEEFPNFIKICGKPCMLINVIERSYGTYFNKYLYGGVLEDESLRVYEIVGGIWPQITVVEASDRLYKREHLIGQTIISDKLYKCSAEDYIETKKFKYTGPYKEAVENWYKEAEELLIEEKEQERQSQIKQNKFWNWTL